MRGCMNRKVELSEENYDLLDEVIHQLCEQGRLLEEQNAMQHGSTSVYEHSVNVAYKSLLLVENYRLPVDKQSLVRGALLHDYFLYDWHKPHGRWHGFKHPAIALKNATRDFKLTEIEKNLIVRHMFPLVPIPPKNIEGGIVCMVDKWCSLKETFCSDIYKKDGMVQQIIKIVEIKLREEETRESTVNISQRHVVL